MTEYLLARWFENIVELDGHVFDVRREIEGIYLLGDFSCVETSAFSGLPGGPRQRSANPDQLGRFGGACAQASSQKITTLPVLPASKVS